MDQDSLECINHDDYATDGVMNLDYLRQKYRLTDRHIEFLKARQVTLEQQRQIRNAPQRSAEWLEARKNRITASNYGAAIDVSEYDTPLQVAQHLIQGGKKFSKFQLKNMEYGTKNEPVAERQYVRYMRTTPGRETPDKFHVSHTGLIVPLAFPWTGISVDGLIYDSTEPVGRQHGGMEIKCPARGKRYEYIPPCYYAQIQGAMGFLGLSFWDFVVWTPDQTQIRRFEFNQAYFEQLLFPELESFYMTKFVPRVVMAEDSHAQMATFSAFSALPSSSFATTANTTTSNSNGTKSSSNTNVVQSFKTADGKVIVVHDQWPDQMNSNLVSTNATNASNHYPPNPQNPQNRNITTSNPSSSHLKSYDIRKILTPGTIFVTDS